MSRIVLLFVAFLALVSLQLVAAQGGEAAALEPMPAPAPAAAPEEVQVFEAPASPEAPTEPAQDEAPKACTYKSWKGYCTEGACEDGHKISGRCGGTATCCVASSQFNVPMVASARKFTPARAPPRTISSNPAYAAPAVVVEGEGTRCMANNVAGTCTAKPCSGTRVSGKCPGDASVTCCIPANAPTAPRPATPAAPAKPAAPATPRSQTNGGAAATPTLALGGTMGASFNVPATGEGSQCQYNSYMGTCTAKACSGTKISGKCPGDASVTCCIPKFGNAVMQLYGPPLPTPEQMPPKPAAPAKPEEHKPLPINMEAPFNYRFPYSAVRHIVADFTLQRIRLYDGAVALKEWKMSSGIAGIGFKEDFPATPAGKFRINMKVGYDQPIGMTFEALTPMKYIAKESDPSAHMTTRILVLEGLDKLNANSARRGIFIHGTNRERNLGKMDSHGCFRMANLDVIELFNNVRTGFEFWAAPKDAWPKTSVPTGVIPALPPP